MAEIRVIDLDGDTVDHKGLVNGKFPQKCESLIAMTDDIKEANKLMNDMFEVCQAVCRMGLKND